MYLDKQIIVINQEKYCYRLGKLGKVLFLLGMLIFFHFVFRTKLLHPPCHVPCN
jgi:hypothetical protein